MDSEISRAEIAKTENFQLLNHDLDQRMLEVWPPQKWGFWCQRRFWSPKKVIGGPKKWKKLFFSKTAHPTIYLKSNMSSVNLMRTSCSGICLGHWLLIFWFTRRAVSLPLPNKKNFHFSCFYHFTILLQIALPQNCFDLQRCYTPFWKPQKQDIGIGYELKLSK